MKSLLLRLIDALNLYPIFNGFTRNTATVFMLHGITPPGEYRYGAISADTLERFFKYMLKNNYKAISLKNYVKALQNNESTFKSVIFTVDDGYRDFYLHAFAVFKKYDYPATIFITSDFIENRLFFWWDTIEYSFQVTSKSEINLDSFGLGKVFMDNKEKKAEIVDEITRFCKKLSNSDKLDRIANLVNELAVDISSQPQGIYEPLHWSEILEMSKSGIDFYPHTKTHPILARVTRNEQQVELIVPKQVIESKIGKQSDIFCYPNGQLGDFNDDTISILQSTGYIAAVTGIEGFDDTKMPVDLFRLKRFSIPEKDIMFKQYICGLERFKRRVLG